MAGRPPRSTLFPSTTLFRSDFVRTIVAFLRRNCCDHAVGDAIFVLEPREINTMEQESGLIGLDLWHGYRIPQIRGASGASRKLARVARAGVCQRNDTPVGCWNMTWRRQRRCWRLIRFAQWWGGAPPTRHFASALTLVRRRDGREARRPWAPFCSLPPECPPAHSSSGSTVPTAPWASSCGTPSRWRRSAPVLPPWWRRRLRYPRSG